jgi:hypothetical protein
MSRSTVHHIAARWSYLQYPSRARECTLDQKFGEIKPFGFYGVIFRDRPGLPGDTPTLAASSSWGIPL